MLRECGYDIHSVLYLEEGVWNLIDIQGKYVPEKCGDRLREAEWIRSYLLVPAQKSATGQDLALSQTDIDALLRSKAAMFTIVTTITRTCPFSLPSQLAPRRDDALGRVPFSYFSSFSSGGVSVSVSSMSAPGTTSRWYSTVRLSSSSGISAVSQLPSLLVGEPRPEVAFAAMALL